MGFADRFFEWLKDQLADTKGTFSVKFKHPFTEIVLEADSAPASVLTDQYLKTVE